MAINKILLVDDSATDLTNLRDAVSSTGAQIFTATSGKEAVELAKSKIPDIIFMDIVMDELDGYGACREIIRNDETKDIPVIFVTSKKQRADKIWAEKQGAKGLISKPYDKKDILDQIQNFA